MAVAVTDAGARKRVFYVGMAVTLLLVVAAGFLPGYYDRALGAEPLPGFVHVHAAFFALWMALLIVQAGLVAAERTSLHRRLGTAAALLVPVMLVLGYRTAIFGARRGHPFWSAPDQPPPNAALPFADSLAFLIVPLGDLVLFTGFIAAALHYRKRPDVHKRLMVLGTIGGMLWPAVTRVPYIAGNTLPMFGVLIAVLAACLAHDVLTRGRAHIVNVLGATVIIASFPLRRWLGTTQAWHDLAAWLTR